MLKKYKLDIIYEDKEVIVINKPSGLLTVSTDKEKEKTLFHRVLMYLKGKNKNNKVFIVHRLDKDTSGIVLFAKNEKLKQLFQNNWDQLVKLRQYVAIVEGKMENKSETLKSWLKENGTLKIYSSQKFNDGKLAITKYRVITTTNKYSLLQVEILTGRKNQIRVQLSDINHPIVGDKKYEAKSNPLRRLGLHANKLIITHPIKKIDLEFEIEVPNDFINMFN